MITGAVKWLTERAHAIITTGGTGITPTDTTIEALERIADKRLPGFGELFRRHSEKEIGAHAALTRAEMYVVNQTPVACLPGSPHAAELGAELLLELLPHAVAHAQGKA
jgi:molybdenum cofactor biosynthesis protein B